MPRGLEGQLFYVRLSLRLSQITLVTVPGVEPQTEQMSVLNGAQLPQDQGWLVSTNAVTPIRCEDKWEYFNAQHDWSPKRY